MTERVNAAYTIPDDPEGSTYRFIIVAAKRARQLQNGARSFLPTMSKKPTVMAMEEVRRGCSGHNVSYALLRGHEICGVTLSFTPTSERSRRPARWPARLRRRRGAHRDHPDGDRHLLLVAQGPQGCLVAGRAGALARVGVPLLNLRSAGDDAVYGGDAGGANPATSADRDHRLRDLALRLRSDPLAALGLGG